jgi:hypothetical protein
MAAQQVSGIKKWFSGKPQAEDTCQPISIKPIRQFIQLSPWLMLVFLPLIVWPSNPLHIPGQVMFYTGYIAAGLALVAFNKLMDKISSTFDTLYQRGILAQLIYGDETAPDGSFPAIFAKFRQDFAGALNSHGQWIAAVVFILLVLTWYLWQRSINVVMQKPILIVGILVEILISFMIGLMAWRMLVVSIQVWRLPKSFRLNLNANHPDQCGGLEPLGNLCLWNALIIACAGVYLGGWIAIGPSTIFRAEILAYKPVFQALLIIPIAVALVSFFLPLGSTHRVMLAKKAELLYQLHELDQRIFKEDLELLTLADQMDPEEGDRRIKKLEMMRKIYTTHQKIPVWPINLSMLSKFVASQVIPVLSLVGVAEPVAKLLSGLVQILSGSG